jgi:hypothetical protein
MKIKIKMLSIVAFAHIETGEINEIFSHDSWSLGRDLNAVPREYKA